MEKIDRGDPMKAQIYLKPPINTTMSNSWEASLQQATQNGMMTVLGLLKSAKLMLRRTSDRGDPMKLLGGRHEKFDLVSLTNEVMLRDRSGRPDDIDSQEEAWPQQFVMGNDETELELSLDSRSFVNRVKDQVRKRKKRISIVTGDGQYSTNLKRSLCVSSVFTWMTRIAPVRIVSKKKEIQIKYIDTKNQLAEF